jgi:hypothetical protein
MLNVVFSRMPSQLLLLVLLAVKISVVVSCLNNQECGFNNCLETSVAAFFVVCGEETSRKQLLLVTCLHVIYEVVLLEGGIVG